MSSHHFVREGQEPALFIVDPVPFDVVAGLLEWSPAVIATAQSLQHVISWGIKVDVVMVREHDIDMIRPLVADLTPVRILPYDEEVRLFQTCLNFLAGEGQHNVTIATSDVFQIFPLLQDHLTSFGVVVHNEVSRWVPVLKTLEKWVPENTAFKIQKTNPDSSVFYSGLTEVADDLISSQDGFIRFWSQDLFWVGQTL